MVVVVVVVVVVVDVVVVEVVASAGTVVLVAKVDGVVTFGKGLGDRTIVGVLPLEA